MEADWEVEIGGGAPVIEAWWDGFVDLRLFPDRAALLLEARQLPALAAALVKLNAPSSPLWTSKCDVWRPTEFDPDELDAPASEGTCALACYIDLLPRADQQWSPLELAVAECRAICGWLRKAPLLNCRADLIVRRAHISSHEQDQGITAYLTGCGPTLDESRAVLETALGIFVECILYAKKASRLQ